MGCIFALACRVGDIPGSASSEQDCVCRMNMYEEYFTEMLGSGSHGGVPTPPLTLALLLQELHNHLCTAAGHSEHRQEQVRDGCRFHDIAQGGLWGCSELSDE